MKMGYVLLYVSDVGAAMDFYAAAFGLTKGFFHDSEQYGEMETGGTKLGFVHHETASGHHFEYERMTPDRKPAGFEVGLVTPDVREAFDKAVRAGALPVSGPETKPWGQTVSYVRDLNGFLVEICSPMG